MFVKSAGFILNKNNIWIMYLKYFNKSYFCETQLVINKN